MNDKRDFSYYLLPGRRIPDDVQSIAPAALMPEAPAEPYPWRRSLAWLLAFMALLLATSALAEFIAAGRAAASGAYAWETRLPHFGWSLFPYAGLDLLCALSFLFWRTRGEADCHALRLTSLLLLSLLAFALFPPMPFPAGAAPGFPFDLLIALDQPFRRLPAFHSGLIVVLCASCARLLGARHRRAVHVAALVAAALLLTSRQHHFIDLPSGALLGAFCLWLWPDGEPSPLSRPHLTASPERRRLARRCLFAAGVCLLAAAFGGFALWLLWPAVALAVAALNYAVAGPHGFQKNDGRLSDGAILLLFPYLLAVWLGSRLRGGLVRHPEQIADGVWLGRLPGTAGPPFAAVLDLSAELPVPAAGWRYVHLAWLAGVPPSREQLTTAAYQIARLRRKGPVLVCSNDGRAHAVCAVAAWLLATGRAASADEALARIAARRPAATLGAAHRAVIATLHAPGA